MHIYNLDEYSKKEYPSLMYDRVITFTLLRSNVYVMIDGEEITISQQPHVLEYATPAIERDEKVDLTDEKSTIERWVLNHKSDILGGIPIEDIITYFQTFDENLLIKKDKPVVYKMVYAIEKNVSELDNRRWQILMFYLKSGDKSKPISRFDAVLDQEHVVASTENIVSGSGAAINYFCNKYFELLKSETPLEDIALLDQGEIIDYAPSINKERVI